MLLDHAVAQQHDAVGKRHRLDLIMRDIDHGRGDLLVEALDLAAHLVAQLGVEVGERLVEQEDARIAHDGAPDGDALALAAGELARIALEQRHDAQHVGNAPDALLDLRSWPFGARAG